MEDKRRKDFTAIALSILTIIVCLSGCDSSKGSVTVSPTTDLTDVNTEESPGTEESPTATEVIGLSEAATTIYYNGVILTMQNDAVVTAIAIKDNIILAVGSDEEVMSYSRPETEIIDLAGRTMMPGIVDAHNHLLGNAILGGGDPLANQQLAISSGITSTGEMYVDQATLDGILSLSEAGEIRIRENLYLIYTTNCGELVGNWWHEFQPQQMLGERVQVAGIKVFADGGSCKIPAMTVEYPGGGTGDLFFTQEEMNQIISEVNDAGFQVAVHALGDLALEEVQNAFEIVLNGQENVLHHRIDHNATIRPDLLPRYDAIGIVATIFGTYPTCIRTSGEGNFKYMLSPDYGAWDWPWRDLIDANPELRPAWHSDYPVFATLDPFYHMWSMVTRKQVDGSGMICEPPDWLAEGALNIEEVLPMMTINGAYALNREDEVGSLVPGKFADLIILTGNPLSTPTDDIKDLQVIMTMIDGSVEYCQSAFEWLCPVD